jgi:hypothetical protein
MLLAYVKSIYNLPHRWVRSWDVISVILVLSCCTTRSRPLTYIQDLRTGGEDTDMSNGQRGFH